jgi:hypothetical protein
VGLTDATGQGQKYMKDNFLSGKMTCYIFLTISYTTTIQKREKQQMRDDIAKTHTAWSKVFGHLLFPYKTVVVR